MARASDLNGMIGPPTGSRCGALCGGLQQRGAEAGAAAGAAGQGSPGPSPPPSCPPGRAGTVMPESCKPSCPAGSKAYPLALRVVPLRSATAAEPVFWVVHVDLYLPWLNVRRTDGTVAAPPHLDVDRGRNGSLMLLTWHFCMHCRRKAAATAMLTRLHPDNSNRRTGSSLVSTAKGPFWGRLPDRPMALLTHSLLCRLRSCTPPLSPLSTPEPGCSEHHPLIWLSSQPLSRSARARKQPWQVSWKSWAA